jgi:hypothetical protein
MIPYVGCEYAREHLDAFVDSELSVDEQVAVESHLRWCRTCAARVEDLQLIGHSIRLGSLAPRGDDEEAPTISHVQASVLIRVRAEEDVRSRPASATCYRHASAVALGATSAVTVGLALALSVLHSTTLERPESLATMLETLSRSCGERNPLMATPHVTIGCSSSMWTRPGRWHLDAARARRRHVFESIPEQDATFAVAAVVSRDGRIANTSCSTPSAASRRQHAPYDVEMLDAAVHSQVRAGADAGWPRRSRQHGVADCDDDGADA